MTRKILKSQKIDIEVTPIQEKPNQFEDVSPVQINVNIHGIENEEITSTYRLLISLM